MSEKNKKVKEPKKKLTQEKATDLGGVEVAKRPFFHRKKRRKSL